MEDSPTLVATALSSSSIRVTNRAELAVSRASPHLSHSQFPPMGKRIATKPALSNSDPCVHVCDCYRRLRFRLDREIVGSLDSMTLDSPGWQIVGTISNTWHELNVTTWEGFEWNMDSALAMILRFAR